MFTSEEGLLSAFVPRLRAPCMLHLNGKGDDALIWFYRLMVSIVGYPVWI